MLLLPLSLLALSLSLGFAWRAQHELGERVAALTSKWTLVEERVFGPESSGEVATAMLAVDRELETLVNELRFVDDSATWRLVFGGTSAFAFAWLLFALQRWREAEVRRAEDDVRRRRAAVQQLLDEITPLSGGDLRIRATVDEATTGALAEAFNHAVAELRRLVGSTRFSAERVSAAVERSRRTARGLATTASVQAREILRASNSLTALGGAMAELSVGAAESARIAERTRSEARTGRRAVTSASVELARIRDEAALATRLMHRMVRNARAIDAEVERVVALARRTDLLALNATIKAAGGAARRGAGSDGAMDAADAAPAEAGRDQAPVRQDVQASGFVRLADEVANLADALGGATREIASLTGGIRDDAGATLRAMTATEASLESGASGVRITLDSLDEIESTVTGLDEVIGDTADRASRHSSLVLRLSGNMGVMNRLSHDGASGVRSAAGQLEDLQAFALELERSVAGFRLPAGALAPHAAIRAETVRPVTVATPDAVV